MAIAYNLKIIEEKMAVIPLLKSSVLTFCNLPL